MVLLQPASGAKVLNYATLAGLNVAVLETSAL